MTNGSPSGDEVLQVREQIFSTRQHSYELTQKLTYFVISAELVFCGYLLLNVDKLTGVKGVSYLFAVCGAAAFFGIFWRFCYNQTYHDRAHGVREGHLHNFTRHMQTVCYNIYVVLSILTFLWGLVAGFNYLHGIKVKAASAVEAPAVTPTIVEKAAPPLSDETKATSKSSTPQPPAAGSEASSLTNPSTGPAPKAAQAGDVNH